MQFGPFPLGKSRNPHLHECHDRPNVIERFLFPITESVTLDSSEFLVDPRTELGKMVNPKLQTIDELAETPSFG